MSKAIRNILDEKLENNDINIVDIILSYLIKCDECDKYDDCKYYLIRECHHYNIYNSCLRCDDSWRKKKLCYTCMVKIMLNHNAGKNGVFANKEFIDKIINKKLYETYNIIQ